MVGAIAAVHLDGDTAGPDLLVGDKKGLALLQTCRRRLGAETQHASCLRGQSHRAELLGHGGGGQRRAGTTGGAAQLAALIEPEYIIVQLLLLSVTKLHGVQVLVEHRLPHLHELVGGWTAVWVGLGPVRDLNNELLADGICRALQQDELLIDHRVVLVAARMGLPSAQLFGHQDSPT